MVGAVVSGERLKRQSWGRLTVGSRRWGQWGWGFPLGKGWNVAEPGEGRAGEAQLCVGIRG